MKKSFFAILICVFCQLRAQTNQIRTLKTYSNSCQLDSIAVFDLRFDNNLNDYVFYKTFRLFYTYDSYGNAINVLLLSTQNNDTTWVRLSNFINTYDSNNNLTDSLFQSWDSSTSQWENIHKHHLIYDSNNNLTSIINQNIYLGNWIDYSRIINTYDLSNKQQSSVFQLWDNINNFWLDKDSTFFYYGSNNKIASHNFYDGAYSVTPVWTQIGKDTIRYNSSDNQYYSIRRNWNNSFGTWDNYQQTNWAYYSNNIIKSIIREDWNTNANQWQVSRAEYFTFDANNNILMEPGPNGGPNGFYYTCVVSGINEKYKIPEFSIFPNPANSTLSITSSIDYSSIKIINSIGQTVFIIENKSEPISVSDLSNDIYFIQIIDKKGLVLKTEKFIKE